MEDRCFFIHDKRVGSPDHQQFWLHRSMNNILLRSSNNNKLNDKQEMRNNKEGNNDTAALGLAGNSSDATNNLHDDALYQERKDVKNQILSSHIDAYYHSKSSQDINGHPFGTQFIPRRATGCSNSFSFQSFYKSVLNANEALHLLSRFQVVQIVKKLRHSYSRAKLTYRYHHTHKLCNAELCMLIQTRAFDVSKAQVEEIPLEQSTTDDGECLFVKKTTKNDCDNSNRRIIMVREVMLEPSEDDDCEEPHFILLFSDHDVIFSPDEDQDSVLGTNHGHLNAVPLTHPQLSVVQKLSGRELDKINKLKKKLNEVENTIPPTMNVFHLCCPNDEQAYDFITEVLDQYVHADALFGSDLITSFRKLESKFNSLMRHFTMFHWPLKYHAGDNDDNEKIALRMVNTTYFIEEEKEEGIISSSAHQKPSLANVWKSFIFDTNNVMQNDEKILYSADVYQNNNKHRLEVFSKLSLGDSLTFDNFEEK